jgi:hypothetical protein
MILQTLRINYHFGVFRQNTLAGTCVFGPFCRQPQSGEAMPDRRASS